ncbi:hypothetical protein [Arthrobacter sp. Soil762]|uniref:hypothetical protein n=1 Tax=Arthrobacter sp. Soil762 TaxID=1736401 RepID=UPI0006F28BDD|nr:hypothetical protein [Arthrobacter sp. Soil762]KRE72618.1 hypothetical protein ASG77_08070 [Arthrobacter sp. Soil762]
MAKSAKTRLGNIWANAPMVDHVLPLAGVALWFFIAQSYFPADDATRRSIYTLIATVSGLAMAATTFACSMTYQSANILMTRVKDLFAVSLKRNWVTIIRSNLMTALIPVVAMAIDGLSAHWAAGGALYAVLLLVARFLRALYWLQYTLFMQSLAAQVPEKVVVQAREDIRS